MKKFIPHGKLHYDEGDTSFVHRELTVYHQEEDAIRFVKLILPATLEIDQIVRERNALAKQMALTKSEEELEKQDAAKLAKSSEEPRAPFTLASKKKRADRLLVEDARAELKYKFEEQRDRLSARGEFQRDQVQIYDWAEPLRLLTQNEASVDDKLKERDAAIFETLKKYGAYRRVGSSFAHDRTLDGLRCLRSSAPHFGQVIDFIEGQARMAQELGEPQHIPPILMSGPPGVGKTHFSLELARALERPVHRHSFDHSHTADALTGGDRHWANSETGLVFRAICMEERADPIFLLDELDKAITYRTGNPLAPLHSLLEPLTARAVKDISTGITFDASFACWVATANDLSLVPPAILSRFRVFEIKTPSAEQAIELAHCVAISVHDRFKGFDLPSRRVITALAPLTPREQMQALDHAFASALVNDRKYLIVQDLPAEVVDLEGDAPRHPRLH